MRRTQSVGRPDMTGLLGTQTAMQNRGAARADVDHGEPLPAPGVAAGVRGGAGPGDADYARGRHSGVPAYEVLSVEEMLRHGERPKLPPVDPRSLVGDTQDKMLIL